MKLQSQYNRITVISTLSLLLIAAIGYYFLLRYVLINQLDEALKVEEVEINDYIKKYQQLPEATVFKDQRIAFEASDDPVGRVFKSLRAYHPAEKEIEPSRQLIFPVEVNGRKYRAFVTKSEEATEHLVWIILFTTLALIVLLTLILFFSNRFLIKKLWQPFRHTLAAIKDFNLSAPVSLAMSPTSIDEFNELNENISQMSQKVLKDYQSLKDFTDHASHEMQTPLAVINSKLDVLIQEPELSEKSMHQIQGIYHATEKLARLSKALLLLTRIENKQYNETALISINGLLEEKHAEWQEWILSGKLHISMKLESLEVKMNPQLAEIMINNLFRNAVRHNTGGNIEIQTGSGKLIFSNTGTGPLDKEKIFDRFYKSDRSEGSGLGLTIVQQICEQNDFRLRYEFIEGRHEFSIDFNN